MPPSSLGPNPSTEPNRPRLIIVVGPNGFIQIAPYELLEAVPPFPAGSLKLLAREVKLHNTFGE
jgi:hypothetical protein